MDAPPGSEKAAPPGPAAPAKKTKKRKKKRKRCAACRTRLPTLRFSCSGCGRDPLCLSCVAPEKHACTHDWKADHRDRLRRENALVRPTTLPDAL